MAQVMGFVPDSWGDRFFCAPSPRIEIDILKFMRIQKWIHYEMDQKHPETIPSGKRLHNYGKSPFFMGKSTISMAIFNSYVSLPEGTNQVFLGYLMQ